LFGFSAFLAFVYLNNPQFPTGLKVWCVVDVVVRSVLVVVFLVSTVSLLLRRSLARPLLLGWALAHLLWLPTTTVVFVQFNEVPPDIFLSLPFALRGGVWLGSILMYIVIALWWLGGPLLVIGWFLRPAIRHEVHAWGSPAAA